MKLGIRERIKLKKIIVASSIPILVVIIVIVIYQLVWKAESDRRYKIMDEQGIYNKVVIEKNEKSSE